MSWWWLKCLRGSWQRSSQMLSSLLFYLPLLLIPQTFMHNSVWRMLIILTCSVTQIWGIIYITSTTLVSLYNIFLIANITALVFSCKTSNFLQNSYFQPPTGLRLIWKIQSTLLIWHLFFCELCKHVWFCLYRLLYCNNLIVSFWKCFVYC